MCEHCRRFFLCNSFYKSSRALTKCSQKSLGLCKCSPIEFCILHFYFCSTYFTIVRADHLLQWAFTLNPKMGQRGTVTSHFWVCGWVGPGAYRLYIRIRLTDLNSSFTPFVYLTHIATPCSIYPEGVSTSSKAYLALKAAFLAFTGKRELVA